MNAPQDETTAPAPPAAKKASLRQVAATMCWALVMIGRRGTWERDGAVVTPTQVVVGAVIATVVVIGLLLLLVRLAVR